MRAVAKLEGVDVAVCFVVKEDGPGMFQWDHSVHTPDAILDGTKENGPNFFDPFTTASSCGEGMNPRLVSCQLELILCARLECSNFSVTALDLAADNEMPPMSTASQY